MCSLLQSVRDLYWAFTFYTVTLLVSFRSPRLLSGYTFCSFTREIEVKSDGFLGTVCPSFAENPRARYSFTPTRQETAWLRFWQPKETCHTTKLRF